MHVVLHACLHVVATSCHSDSFMLLLSLTDVASLMNLPCVVHVCVGDGTQRRVRGQRVRDRRR